MAGGRERGHQPRSVLYTVSDIGLLGCFDLTMAALLFSSWGQFIDTNGHGQPPQPPPTPAIPSLSGSDADGAICTADMEVG